MPREPHIHRAYQADWWPAAKALADAGFDPIILDPDAEGDEDFFDGNEDHGVISVKAHVGLGWVVLVNQTQETP
jgi:hypothetical protein